MSDIWLTADLHLGHPLVAEMRGFPDTRSHDDALAARWDAQVGKRDRVIVLGDLCIGRGMPHHNALEWVGARPGIIDLIFGNHDVGHPMHTDAHKRQAEYFRVFRSAQAMGMLKVAGERVMLNHFPFAADHTEVLRYPEWRPRDAGQWLVHGHTHSEHPRNPDNPRELHVGLDAHGLSLVPLRWITQCITESRTQST